MSFEDDPTQQLRRPAAAPAPLPGPLNPIRPAPSRSDTTEILPIDQIFEPRDTSTPAAPPVSQPSLVERIRSDTFAAASSSWNRSRNWLGHADNMLVTATVVITLLLLGVIAAL